MQKMESLGSNSISNSSGRLSTEENDDEEISRLAISAYHAKEEEIERKKMEVKEKVELQLGRAGEETRRLAQIWEELEVMGDPMRRELANVRKKIDMANRELKPLGLSCQRKVQSSILHQYKHSIRHLLCWHYMYIFLKIRRKINIILSVNKQEKEYQEALESFNEKNKEKARLLLTESEKLRMQKLEKLSKNIEPTL
ncbi:uncharacterized protein LOC103929519 [Pyrus x bretschneideri]|uniref:uncharacterized protein LOC103929519 n=1 Tax=Pyrus x bretschneideri TaxID=225117 RepID=UPI002030831C|nr:uncharacterized protein LOC103929519 [Pyrus x bretschneideri]